MKKITEQEARLMPLCPACGRHKSHGEHAQIVCWSCWRDPVNPFKYYQGTFEQWMAEKKRSLLDMVKAGDVVAADDWVARASNGEIMRIV